MIIKCFIIGHNFETKILTGTTEVKDIISTCTECGKQIITKTECTHQWTIIDRVRSTDISFDTKDIITLQCSKCGDVQYRKVNL